MGTGELGDPADLSRLVIGGSPCTREEIGTRHRDPRIIFVCNVHCEQPWRAPPLEVGHRVDRAEEGDDDRVAGHLNVELWVELRSCANFCSPSHFLIPGGDAEHPVFRLNIRHLFGAAMSLLGAIKPVLCVLQNALRHAPSMKNTRR